MINTERFYEINRRHPFSEQWFDAKRSRQNQRVVFEKLREEFGIETTDFHSDRHMLYIKPTPADSYKFKYYFDVSEKSTDGLRGFGIGTAVHTMWFRSLNTLGVEVVNVPSPRSRVYPEYARNDIIHQHMFDYQGIVYCTIMGRTDFDVIEPLFRHIQGSEYHMLKERHDVVKVSPPDFIFRKSKRQEIELNIEVSREG